MIQPTLVHGLTLRDLTFRASPNWSAFLPSCQVVILCGCVTSRLHVGIHPLLCDDVLATNITIESGQFDGDSEYQGHNVDGKKSLQCVFLHTIHLRLSSAFDLCDQFACRL